MTKDLKDKISILNGAKYVSLGTFPNYLVFIQAAKYIKIFQSTNQIYWESIENITKSDRIFAPTFVYHHSLPDINFIGHWLIRNNISDPKKVINLYISYTLGLQLRNSNTDFTLSNCLFGSVKLTKNADLDKYKYYCYGIGFDSHSDFLFTDGSYGKNVIIFGANMSSSVHIDNKGKDILISWKIDYVSNPATCNCENGKYLASIMDDSVNMCDEFTESYDEETKAIPTSFSKKQKKTCKTQNFYILLVLSLVSIT